MDVLADGARRSYSRPVPGVGGILFSHSFSILFLYKKQLIFFYML